MRDAADRILWKNLGDDDDDDDDDEIDQLFFNR